MLETGAIRARLADVRERIARAAGRAGRDPASVRLVAVSKTFTADYIRAVADCGQVDFGENKVQEALTKMDQTADLSLRWHLVGHLQSNKAKKAGTSFDMVHSVHDSALAGRLDEAAAAAGREVRWLIQVDLAGEPTKHGIPAAEVAQLCAAAKTLRAARLAGLMLLPPAVDNPDQVRPYFRALRAMRDDLAARDIDPLMLTELSMGMSHDFETAVEEGATMVRVGTAIFGSRNHV